MKNNDNVFEISDGNVRAWIEQGNTVHIKAVDRYGDPVEVTTKELKSLIDELSRLYKSVECE
jgi:gamma-glutamyltranspeptidase